MTAPELRTVSHFYLRKTRVLPLTEILPTSSGRPLSALAVVFRAPSPYPSFARFPPFPLLGGVIAEPGIHLVGIFGVFTPGIFLGHPLQTKRKEDANLFFPSSFQKGGRGQTAKEVDF